MPGGADLHLLRNHRSRVDRNALARKAGLNGVSELITISILTEPPSVGGGAFRGWVGHIVPLYAQATPELGRGTHNAFLHKHAVGNPGGNTELFERLAPGQFKLVRPLKFGFE